MKKIVALILAVIMIASVAALAGCSESNTTETGKEKLVMATNASFPPYEYKEDGETIIGIDAEIAQAIADKLDMELEIKDVEFATIVEGVKSGMYDIGMAGMTVTEERLESVNFSTPYAQGVQVVIVKEDSPITSVDDLLADGAEYTVGVQTATTGHIYMTDDIGEDRVVAYNTGNLAVTALLTGKVDCVVIDNEPAKAYVNENEGLKILDTEYVVEDYAICVSKDNEELLNKINKALGELTADGTIQTILDKYIKAD